MKNFYSQLKEIAFLVAGTILALFVTIYHVDINNNIRYLVILFSLLILFGLGVFDNSIQYFKLLINKINRKFGIVGIYTPYHRTSKNSSWVNLSTKQIQRRLRSKGIKSVVFRNEFLFDCYPIVINPYGGVYPEKDLSILKSFNNILMYVKSGGIYVNIADIPFYYAYDDNFSRMIDTTPLAGPVTLTRSFFQTLLTSRLQEFVVGIDPKINNGISRIISLSNNSINLYPKTFPISPNLNGSPQLAFPYGNGKFIFSTTSKDLSNIDELINLIDRSLDFV